MSNTVQEQLTVEAVTQYGIRVNGKNYGISPRLKEAGTTPDKFQKGATYLVEVYTGPKGGKSINSFALVGPAGLPSAIASQPLPSPVPSLPPTTLAATPAPTGAVPVTPAAKKADVDSEKMTKKDWANKDRTIELQAIMKSTLESPMVAQLAVGKRIEEVLETVKTVYEFSLALYDSKK